MTKGFIAFPDQPAHIGVTIRELTEKAKEDPQWHLVSWPMLNIQGLKIDKLIRDTIELGDFLIADITYPNFNVYYEIGYCLGCRRPCLPIVDVSKEAAISNVSITGLFDTWGQIRYQNSDDLFISLAASSRDEWSSSYIHQKNHSQPLFILDTLTKTDFRNWIFQTAANSSIELRRYDPVELPKLFLHNAISDISASAGVILPLLAADTVDSQRNNLKAAFLAGLAHGYGLEPLIIQFDDQPAPVDFRDFIETVRGKRETEQAVGEYCQATLIRNQQPSIVRPRGRATILEKIDLGSSNAEAEHLKLQDYFLRTAEYAKALNANGGVVVGRKGSGKSAIFYRISDEKSRDRRNLVVELSPDSHNLSELREALLEVMSAGIFDHTIAAFWQYILYAEILLKIREWLLPKARFNLSLLQRVQEIENKYLLTEEMVAADFTGRLELAVAHMIQAISGLPPGANARQQFTNLLFEDQIPALRDTIIELSSDLDSLVLLFDNVDKGWPSTGIEQTDIRMIRHLAEQLGKIQRELGKRSVTFEYLLFLRSDVFEQLVQETSDRGKYNAIRIDWSDGEQLTNLMQRRATYNFDDKDADRVWAAINPVMNGSTGMAEMIKSSLMRPRFLIDLCENALSFAINRGHATIQAVDIESALERHSLYLVSYFGFEIRDLSGISEAIFYQFVGEGSVLTESEVEGIIARVSPSISVQDVIRLLIWYGFLGIPDQAGNAVYIYDRNYDIRRIEAERAQQGVDNILYVINPAFMRGLSRS
jgi:hypothetical protein